MLGWLADQRSGGAVPQLVAGQPRTMRSEQPLTVTTPTGRQVSVAPDEDGQATFEDTFVPGHYRVELPDAPSVFAVEVDPAESDTRWQPLAASPLQDGEHHHVAVTVPRWRVLWWLIGVLLAAEALLRWRAHRTRR